MGRGRPPLAIGTYGTIKIAELNPSLHEARTRFRDADGVTRLVSRRADTKGRAERALKAALVERQTIATGEGLTADSTVDALADRWVTELATRTLATNTRTLYAYTVDRYVKPRLGSLRVSEVTTARVQAVLNGVGVDHGTDAAKTTRSVLNGIFGLAARHDVLRVNPVREAKTPQRPMKKELARAFTRAEADDFCDWLRTNPKTMERDLPDLVDFMLGTGCRIGEACAVRYVDGSDGVMAVNATVIRVKGVGLVRQPHPKSAAGARLLPLPSHLVEMIERRQGETRFRAAEGVIFGSPFARALRDPSNTEKHLRWAFDTFACPECSGTGIVDKEPCTGKGPLAWARSHTFRKTVATWLDEAGLTPRQVADYLGHAQPSMTQNVYIGRKVVSSEGARALER